MYKCLNCGHVFDEGEQQILKDNHGMEGGFYEKMSVCPMCGGDYEEAEYCQRCEQVFIKDKLFNGICEDCLNARADYDTVLRYLNDTNQLEVFADFYFTYCSTPTNGYNDMLIAALIDWYKRQKVNDLLCRKTDFLKACKDFVLKSDGEFGLRDFAEWLKKAKEV